MHSGSCLYRAGIFHFLVAAFLAFGPFSSFAAYGWEPYKVDLKHPAPYKYDEGLDHLEPTQYPGKYPNFLVEFAILSEKRTFCQIVETTAGYNLFKWDEIGTSEKHVNEVSIPIPDDIVDTVYQLWINALLETRYDPLGTGGSDGATFIFTATVGRPDLSEGKVFCGKVWGPQLELPPGWMASAGDAVLQYA